jgi:hypothetical protein
VIRFIGASTGIKNSGAARWDKTSRAVVPGAACLTPYLAFAAPERISRDPWVRHKAAPLQALGTNGLWQRAKPFEDEDEDEYEWAGGCAYSSDSASPPAA